MVWSTRTVTTYSMDKSQTRTKLKAIPKHIQRAPPTTMTLREVRLSSCPPMIFFFLRTWWPPSGFQPRIGLPDRTSPICHIFNGDLVCKTVRPFLNLQLQQIRQGVHHSQQWRHHGEMQASFNVLSTLSPTVWLHTLQRKESSDYMYIIGFSIVRMNLHIYN